MALAHPEPQVRERANTAAVATPIPTVSGTPLRIVYIMRLLAAGNRGVPCF